MTTRRGLHGECAVRDTLGLRDERARYRRTAHAIDEPLIADQTWEKWMKLVKTSAITFAVSAMLAGPVLAQGVSSDTQIRGGAQGRTNMQGGASVNGAEDLNAQTGAPGEKAGVNAKAGAKGTVGTGSAAPKGTAGAAGGAAAGGKRY
jgi:hypothetical protein